MAQTMIEIKINCPGFASHISRLLFVLSVPSGLSIFMTETHTTSKHPHFCTIFLLCAQIIAMNSSQVVDKLDFFDNCLETNFREILFTFAIMFRKQQILHTAIPLRKILQSNGDHPTTGQGVKHTFVSNQLSID
jgi:hypothetical protein